MRISDWSSDVCSSDLFVTEADKAMIRKDQTDCMGCLSHCGFSSWKDHDDYTTGYLADPRSFCIQKTLQEIAQGGDVEQNLMLEGHAACTRSDKRSVGKGGVSPCGTRGSPYR